MEEYLEAPKPITAAQKQGLAKMYADEGIRSYLVHAAQIANQNMIKFLKVKNAEEAQFYCVRHTILTNLLEKAKDEFINSEKVEKK